MNAIIDATLTARAPRGASPVALVRSIGGLPGRTSTLSGDVGDEDDISISGSSIVRNRRKGNGIYGKACCIQPGLADHFRRKSISPWTKPVCKSGQSPAEIQLPIRRVQRKGSELHAKA